MCQQRNCVSPKQANRAASYIDGLHARCVGPLPGSIKRLIDALDVPLPNGPLDIRQRALAQADLVEPIIVTLSLMTRQAVPTKSSPDPSIRRSRAVSANCPLSRAHSTVMSTARPFFHQRKSIRDLVMSQMSQNLTHARQQRTSLFDDLGGAGEQRR
jgi:hypothetical protein